MEKPLSCRLILSLQEIALRQVPIILLKGSDILNSIASFQNRADDKQSFKIFQETVENKVKDKVLNLQFPESLLKQILSLVKPFCFQLLRWKMFHDKIIFSPDVIDVSVLKLLVWTSAGTIDYEKTAEEFIHFEMFDSMNRFRLASKYFLVNSIPNLWDELPIDSKRHICEKDCVNIEFIYWFSICKGDETTLNTFSGRTRYFGDFLDNRHTVNQNLFTSLALAGNKKAANFFYQKLTHEEREASLIKTACRVIEERNNCECCAENYYSLRNNFPKEKLSDVLCCLLSKMSLEQQIEFFKKDPGKVLLCFLDWPWQDLLMDTSDVIWSFIPKCSYDIIILNVFDSVFIAGQCIPNTFHKFFLGSCCRFKRYLIDHECNDPNFFREFCKAEDTETIKLILQNVDAQDRLRLVCGFQFFQLLKELMKSNQWHLVELFIRESTVSEEDRKRMKRLFENYLQLEGIHGKKLETFQWRRFLEFFDAAEDNSSSKRSIENVTLQKGKKLQK